MADIIDYKREYEATHVTITVPDDAWISDDPTAFRPALKEQSKMTDIHQDALDAYHRAVAIEKMVWQYEGCDGIDAADLASDEIRRHPSWTDEQVARVVAQRIAQP